MHVSLTPELEARVKAKVESGLYNNAGEVIREALRFLETHEAWVGELKLVRLREQISQGLVQLEQEQSLVIESRECLDGWFAAIKAAAIKAEVGSARRDYGG